MSGADFKPGARVVAIADIPYAGHTAFIAKGSLGTVQPGSSFDKSVPTVIDASVCVRWDGPLGKADASGGGIYTHTKYLGPAGRLPTCDQCGELMTERADGSAHRCPHGYDCILEPGDPRIGRSGWQCPLCAADREEPPSGPQVSPATGPAADAGGALGLEPMLCACGSHRFMKFGPYGEPGHADASDDIGLKIIYTCSACGEQLRVYQTSDAWRSARVGLPPLEEPPPDSDSAPDLLPDAQRFVEAKAGDVFVPIVWRKGGVGAEIAELRQAGDLPARAYEHGNVLRETGMLPARRYADGRVEVLDGPAVDSEDIGWTWTGPDTFAQSAAPQVPQSVDVDAANDAEAQAVRELDHAAAGAAHAASLLEAAPASQWNVQRVRGEPESGAVSHVYSDDDPVVLIYAEEWEGLKAALKVWDEKSRAFLAVVQARRLRGGK